METESNTLPPIHFPRDKDDDGNYIYEVVGYELLPHDSQDFGVVEDIERQINLRLAEMQD